MKKDELWMPDLGNGCYRNPILFCDYSDPDAIRVGDTYYLTASTFNYVPGLPILTSKDLVNWTLRGHALSNIPEERYGVPRHAQGVWAPAIRYHEGHFYIFYGMPDEGIYMVRAEDALGPWDDPVCVLQGKGLIDPCPLWDDDGRAWVVHGYAKSRIGFKSILGIFPMSWDATHAIGDDHLLFDGQETQPTIEGPKVYKRNGWYYIFAPAGGVPGGWQTVLRSRSITGPYEERIVLKQGGTQINGPHQGAWVDTPEGEDWFLHFQSRGLYGRITHLQPMAWREDDWPWIGEKDENPIPFGEDEGDGNKAARLARAADCGVPVTVWHKPKGPEQPRTSEQGSDQFDAGRLGLQWQFMGNWRPDFYEVGERKLRLFARCLPEHGETLWQCPQTLSQKIACPAFKAQVTLDGSALKAGEQAGVALVGGQYAYLALRRTEDAFTLAYVLSEGEEHREQVEAEIPLSAPRVALRMTLVPTGYDAAQTEFAYSVDGERFLTAGKPFAPARHTWVGARLALFAMPLAGGEADGYAEFGPFTVETLEVET